MNPAQIDVPFSARNAVWCVGTYRPYLPHRDPKNVQVYVAPPNPVKDPNWMAACLPQILENVKAEDAVVTEATVIPSIHSEEYKMYEAQGEPQYEQQSEVQCEPQREVKSDSPRVVQCELQFEQVQCDLEAQCEPEGRVTGEPLCEPVYEVPCEPPQRECAIATLSVGEESSSPLKQQAMSNVAVVSAYSSPASEHAADMSLPSPTIVNVMPHPLPWQQVSEPCCDVLPLRPATAFENRKLENVMFDSDGHIGFTTQCNTTQPLCVRREKTTPIIMARREEELLCEEEALYEAAKEEKNVNKATAVALGMNDPVSMTEAASQTCLGRNVTPKPDPMSDVVRWLLNKCPHCALFGVYSQIPCEVCSSLVKRESKVMTKHEIIEKVGDVYESWGLNRDDAYVDVITGFHKVGNPGKRLCLGVSPDVGKRVVMEISTWTTSHLKVTIVTETYVLATETCRDDQILKFIKDCLWFLYNNGSPLDVVVVDNTVRNWTAPGKYYTASVEPLDMLGSLVKAWGANYQHVKVR